MESKLGGKKRTIIAPPTTPEIPQSAPHTKLSRIHQRVGLATRLAPLRTMTANAYPGAHASPN